MIPIGNSVPSRYPAVMTWALIAANCIVFLLQLSLGPFERLLFAFQFGLVPARYFESTQLTLGDFVPFITMMFLHGGWLHLIINMWMLWLFGRTIEDRLGPGRFLLFYFVCGMSAAATDMISRPDSIIPAVGASGAIAGVLACYVRMFPSAKVLVVVPILFVPLFFAVPALVFVGIWFLLQVLQATFQLLMPSEGGGVAWWAHVGGFVGGLLLGPLMQRSTRLYRRYYNDEGVFGFEPSGR
jgi:membrane associated rhomboid family serine protease